MCCFRLSWDLASVGSKLHTQLAHRRGRPSVPACVGAHSRLLALSQGDFKGALFGNSLVIIFAQTSYNTQILNSSYLLPHPAGYRDHSTVFLPSLACSQHPAVDFCIVFEMLFLPTSLGLLFFYICFNLLNFILNKYLQKFFFFFLLVLG